MTASTSTPSTTTFVTKDKPMEVRISNVAAAKSVAQVLRSSLGPRGLDKMIKSADGKILITNDGATILKHMALIHPCARMLVELSAAQDAEAGDGTTSVVVVAGALLGAVERLLQQGLHPSLISEAFLQAVGEAHRVLDQLATPVNLSDREALIRAAMTSLGSKVVAPYAQHVAGIAVDAVLQVATGNNQADLADVRVVTRVGGTIDEMRLVEGLLLRQTLSKSAPDAPTRMEKARIGLVQFQLSAPKTDMESAVVVTDYQQMDRLLAEERAYLLNLCKRIKKAGCNVLLVQKSILREGVSELAHHYLAKLKIMVVPDIEREEIEFLSHSLGCKPIADSELFTEDRLGSADLVEEIDASYLHITGIKLKNQATRKTCSILVRGGSHAVLAEAERSLHDALCVIRCLVRQPAMIVGGGAPEAEMSFQLGKLARTMSSGAHARCIAAYAEALEAIPTALAENAGLDSIVIGTELRARHASGHATEGINVRKACIGEMAEERVVQPLLVSKSVIQLATETVCQILKIDDIIQSR